MRIPRILAALAGLTLMTGAAAYAQTQSTGPIDQSTNRVYGYVDLRTGAFHPGRSQADATPDSTVTLKTFTGTIEAKITITISSATAAKMPKGSTILCDLQSESFVDGSDYEEVAAAAATISGDTATCTVNLPYSWTGNSAGTTSAYYFEGSYKITATYAPSATQPLTDYNIIRQTTGPLETSGAVTAIPIPASGTTTSFSIDATI
jgi:hypothetical protein